MVGRNAAALGDLDRRRQRLREVGEQHGHFGAGLEAVVGGELIAVGFGDQPTAGDAEQRVMGFVVVSGREKRLVGRNQRKALGVGEIDQAGLGAALLFDAVALQLDIEAIAEQACQPIATGRRQRGLIGCDRERNRPLRTAGQSDQVFGIALQPIEPDVRRLVDRRFQEGPRVQPHQAAVAALTRRQQHDPGRSGRQRVTRSRVLVTEIDRQFAANDRLDTVAGELVGKFERAEHIVGVGQRQRRLAVRFRQFRQFLDLDRALQQRIGRVNVEMDKSGAGHGRGRFLRF